MRPDSAMASRAAPTLSLPFPCSFTLTAAPPLTDSLSTTPPGQATSVIQCTQAVKRSSANSSARTCTPHAHREQPGQVTHWTHCTRNGANGRRPSRIRLVMPPRFLLLSLSTFPQLAAEGSNNSTGTPVADHATPRRQGAAAVGSLH